MNDEQFFYQPTRGELESGLACDEPDCTGHYVAKKRDITMRRKSGPIVIKDSEYWECDTCGSFVTAKEEVQRIRDEAKELTEYTGRLTLRLPPELHRELVLQAKTNHRSLNNELTYRLERSLKNSDS